MGRSNLELNILAVSLSMVNFLQTIFLFLLLLLEPCGLLHLLLQQCSLPFFCFIVQIICVGLFKEMGEKKNYI